MKRILIIFIASLLLVACGTPSEEKDKAVATPTATAIPDADVEKEQVDINGHHYEYVRYKIRDGKIYLLSLKTKENDLIIPSEIEGIPVEEVGLNTDADDVEYEEPNFKKLYWLLDKEQVYNKVVFSNGIHKVRAMIGIAADEMIFGKDIEYIESACLHCETEELKVKNMRFECTNVEIEMMAFTYRVTGEVVFAPEFGGTIGMGAFSESHIKKITWPGGNVKIGDDAFRYNKELQEVIFPENCEQITIPDECFRGCENLNKLVFPAHVKKVVYKSSACADNYDFQGVETLEFKGKDTELVGIRNEKNKLHKLITVKKIIAPKGSKAIDFAKKAQNVAYIKPETVRKNGWMKNPSNQRDNLDFHDNSIRLGMVEWEYN